MLALIFSHRSLHPATGDHPDRFDRLVNFNPTRLVFSERCRAASVDTGFAVSKPIEWIEGDVDHFGNAAADDFPVRFRARCLFAPRWSASTA